MDFTRRVRQVCPSEGLTVHFGFVDVLKLLPVKDGARGLHPA